MIAVIGKHKGYDIHVSQSQYEKEADFYTYIGDTRVESKDYYSLIGKIDRILKADFERITVIVFPNYYNPFVAEITSFTDDGKECWIIDEKNKRQKVYVSQTVEGTKDRIALVAYMSKLVQKHEKESARNNKELSDVIEKIREGAV